VGSDFLMFYIAYGGRLYDEDSARLVVTRSALLEWFRFQRRVITSGVTPATLMGTAKRIWHDNVAHHNVLFWSDGCWAWGDWIENYLEGDAAATFPERTGYALMPSGIRGRSGSTLSHPMVYMVTKSSVSGKKHQEPAQRLLAHMTTPKRAMRHAVESAHLSIMRNSSYDPPEGPQSDRAMAEQRRFLRSVSYMLDHNYYLPNSPYYSQYFEIVWENMLATTLSKRSPERAAELAIAELRTELGDALLVE
jgi:inositol-phosphate transport system substrate-binding protein